MRIDRAAAVAVALMLAMPAAAQTVFINEIHYDNASTDAGEAIEVAGPAGTDLTGWSIVLYNGNGGAAYDTDSLSGTIPDSCSGFGTVFLAYAVNGIQNGNPDGIALVDSTATVVQFLSYGGTFTAVGGPANGMTSTSIGIAESSSTPVGHSLQLTGSGSQYTSFTWAAAANTFGSCNTGQTFVNSLRIDDVTHAEGDGGATTTYTFTVSLAAPAPGGGVTFDIATADDSATTADGDYLGWTSIGESIAAGAQTKTFDVTVYDDATYEPDETFVVNVGNVVGVALGDGQGVGTITDDDGVKVSIVDVTQAEGNGGTTTFSFTVLLSKPANVGGVTFDVTTVDDTATTADGDYVASTLTNQFIAGGLSSTTVDVTVNGDTVFEGDEAFFIQVTNVAGTDAYLGDGVGVGTIANDDATLLVINEIDYDQPTPPTDDSAEFIELYNKGAASIALGTYSLRLVNGLAGGASIYDTIDLPDVALAPGEFFVICANAATVPNCDLDDGPNTNFIQNGPDAVALMNDDVLIDTVSYGGDTGAPYTEGSGSGLVDDSAAAFANAGISRYPDGTDTNVNNVDLSVRCITPGLANASAASGCPTAYLYNVMVNEVDADTTGTDTAEFIELFDGGKGSVPLTGLAVVLYNGSNDQSYAAFDLDTYSTDATGYFVICGNAANVANCDLDVSPDADLIQNGQDAVALYRADATAFPNGTAVSTTNLQDALVYDTNDADDAGLLVLLNAGQPQVNESGTGASDTNSNQRCPSGYGGQRNTTSYVQMAPTPGVAGVCAFEIFTIQGSGLASPFAGFQVTTNDNVVTAVGPQGFFIQTPDARADADVNGTSNGIYVFTSSLPTVAVGNQVDVAGTVQEYFDFTEFSGTPTVVVDVASPALPAAVAFDEFLPSPSQPQPANAIERYEGMRIAIANGTVSGPSQYFGSDPTAEAFIVAAPSRPYREIGILYPGLFGLPVWDGNPEVFELDPDKLGLVTNVALNAGSTFAAEGVLAYEFEGYELWATSLTGVAQPALPAPVRALAAGELAIGSFNTLHLFDDVDDPLPTGTGDRDTDYALHLQKLSMYVRDVLGAPDVLGVQEVEHIGALQGLAARILADDPSVVYTAYLVEGNDIGGIDVGFLVRDTVTVDAVTQLGAGQTLSVDNSLLHDRPPLLLEADYVGNGAPFPIKVLVLHQRSLNDIESPTTGGRVRQKRLEQAQAVAQMVQDLQTADPAVRLVVLGDFNAFEVTDGYVDVTGQIKGDFVPADNLLSGPDLVSPDLVDEVLNLPAAERYSYGYYGTAQVLDHALTSQGIAAFVRGMAYGRGNADAPEALEYDATTPLRCSDHDGLVLFVMSDFDGDGNADDAPEFLVLSNANALATGEVSDPSGIASLVLGGGSSNVRLGSTGNPGDGTWRWVVRLVNQTLPGQAELIATDEDGATARLVVALQGMEPIPVASPAGLALLALLIAAGAVVALRRLG